MLKSHFTSGGAEIAFDAAAFAKTYVAPPSKLECVLPNEREAAERFAQQEFIKACGKAPPHVAGYNVLIRVYQRDPIKILKDAEGKDVEFVTRTEKAMTADKYQSVVGLVVGMGPQAYKGTNFDGTPRFPEGVWCMVGDWVVIPRYEGTQFSYGDKTLGMSRFVPLIAVADDKIIAKVNDPEDVVATHVIDVEMS